ncbi:MAG TPA: glycosyltransferase family 39 protein [Blastocatellia bacterium]|nr:glycosyltransferase family 39 protein [Blastocatellia bacterium]
MFETGDWITPRLAGINWFEKPALTYWLAAAGYAIFGVSEFAARFGIAIMASLGALLLFFFGRQLGSPRLGYLGASVLMTCGLWPGFARATTFDLPLSVAMELGLLSFYLWERTEEPKGRTRLWWLFCFSIGLAFLAKGLVGILLPLAIAGPYLLLTGRLKAILKPRLLILGSLVVAVTAATWYWPVISRNGAEFVNEFFMAHHFQRYLSNKYRHPQPVYFFLLVAFIGSFPWSFYLASNAWGSIRRWRSNFRLTDERLNLFLWLWILVPIIFFSFSGSKLPGYILPIFPALALIVGLELERWWKEEEPRHLRLAAVATALLLVVAGVLISLRGQREIGLNPFNGYKLATLAIVVAVVYLGLWFLLNGRVATIFLPFGLVLIVMATVNLVFPDLGRSESLRDLSVLAKQVARPGERLVFYITQDHGVNFYATDLPLRDRKSELITITALEEIEPLIRANGGTSILVLSQRRWISFLNRIPGVDEVWLGEQPNNLGCSPDCVWVLFRAQLKTPENAKD